MNTQEKSITIQKDRNRRQRREREKSVKGDMEKHRVDTRKHKTWWNGGPENDAVRDRRNRRDARCNNENVHR